MRSPKQMRALAGVVLVTLLAFAVVVWRNPLWLFDSAISAALRFNGVQSEFVTLHGYRMHYLAGGSGEPLVLVHGLGSRAADWANLMPRLIHGGHRVYALDLLGYGQSAQPTDDAYSIASQAKMVEAFLDDRKLATPDLAGWSMGGWIAMRVALDEPERIRRLVLLDSAGLRFKMDYDPSLLSPQSPRDLAALEQRLVPDAPPLPGFLATALLRRSNRTGWVVNRSLQSMMQGDDLVDGKLGSLTMPVLIGWGEQDRLIPLAVGYRLHAEILQSVLDVYSGCGHLAPEQCAEQVGPSVVEFLNARPARMAMVRMVPKASEKAH